MVNSIEKQPAEKYPIAFNYYGRLPAGTRVVSGAVTARNITDNADASNVLLPSSVAIAVGSQLRFYVQGGVTGKTYSVTCIATLNDGSTLEDEVTIKVVAVP